jgi:hypothetical protein
MFGSFLAQKGKTSAANLFAQDGNKHALFYKARHFSCRKEGL